jgi:hypothetical protein
LYPNILVESPPSQTPLSFNIPSVDELFPGFTTGSFAVLHGTRTVLPLTLLLAVRAQLPSHLGGLKTNVVFVDGGNTFRLYDVSRIAQLHHLDPKQVLERIFISRAFTAYQMTSILLEKLKKAVHKFNSKLVIVLDISGLYSDKDVPKREAKSVFNQLTTYLSKFAEENQLITIATCLPHTPFRQDNFFRASVCGGADIVISIKPSKLGQQFILEKHPTLTLGCAEFHSENLTLDNFMGMLA